MRHSRAQRFPQSVRATLIEWHVECGAFRTICIEVAKPGAPSSAFALDPEDAYDFAHDILRSYDEANGI